MQVCLLERCETMPNFAMHPRRQPSWPNSSNAMPDMSALVRVQQSVTLKLQPSAAKSVVLCANHLQPHCAITSYIIYHISSNKHQVPINSLS